MVTGLHPRLHHFALSVADIETSATWYEDKLGFREDYRYAVPEVGLHAVFLVLDGLHLELFQQAGSHPPDPDELVLERYLVTRGLKHIAFAVDDVAAARADLAKRGVPFVNDVMIVPDSGGERFCFFTDPDGVLIELFEAVADHEHVHGVRS